MDAGVVVLPSPFLLVWFPVVGGASGGVFELRVCGEKVHYVFGFSW